MNQNYQFIELKCDNAQATLILNRPPVNVINLPMMEELLNALRNIQDDSSIRLLHIRGQGRCFSAGMDVEDHLPEKVKLMLEKMRSVLQCLDEMPIPVICILHGMALGGGLEIAMIADFVYAESKCKIGQPEIQLGVFPPAAVAFYPKWFGSRIANDLVLTGRTLNAGEALQLGLLNGVFTAEELETQISNISQTLLSRSRAAVSCAKQALRKVENEISWNRLKVAERIYLEELMGTDDALEGLHSFLEKREPRWKHR